jgi:hypothetical protein
VHAAERNDARNPAAGPDDHTSSDLLAQDPIRRADVVAPLGRDCRGLQAEAVLPDRARRLVDDGVVRPPPGLEREVEAGELELEPDHVGSQDAQAFLQELLAGLVSVQHHDRLAVHGFGD